MNIINITYKTRGGDQSGTGVIVAETDEFIIFKIDDNGEVPIRKKSIIEIKNKPDNVI